MIRAAREGGWERVVAVFQPHRYTRTAALWRDFADAFVGADALVLTDVYPAGEQPQPGRVRAARAPSRARRPPRRGRRLPARGAPTSSPTCPASPAPATSCSPSAPATSPPCPTSGWRRAVVTAGPPGLDPAGLAARSRRPGYRSSATCPSPTSPPTGSAARWRCWSGSGRPRSSPRSPRRWPSGVPPLLVVGRGSNLLVADAGFPGSGCVLESASSTTVGPRRRIADVVRAGARGAAPGPRPAHGRRPVGGGLEFFVGIPGSVGGAVRMNAGGHGRETADVLIEADVVDLAAGRRPGPTRRPAADLGLGYRRVGGRPDRGGHRRELPRHRRRPPPRARRASPRSSAGGASTSPAAPTRARCSRNPPGDSAGRLIDSLGLKGLRVGGAVVSPKHANFFQAEAGATADDVHRARGRGAAAGARRHRHRARARAAHGRLRRTTVPARRGRREHPRTSPRTDPAGHARRAAARASPGPAAAERRRRDAGVACAIVSRHRRGARRRWRGRSSVSPLLDVDQVDVRGTRTTSPPAEVERGRRVHEGDAMVWLDPSRVVARPRGAAVRPRGATVSREWPDTVASPCTSARPVAWVDGAGGQGAWSTAPGGCSRRSTRRPRAAAARSARSGAGARRHDRAASAARAVAGGSPGSSPRRDRVGRDDRPRSGAPPRAPDPRSASGSPTQVR